jgi:regulator of protease activity HflC (stomatin/prohibitin superfamily)/divalent metal cation (Fe/Co/Zn/Cd) transporter
MASTPPTSIAPTSVTADPRVFQRATTVALVGLAIQGVLAVATGLVALWSDSQAVYAAGWHMLGGLPIWIMLAVIYSQHESERTQRLAADKLAADSASTAAIFANLDDDLDAARRRLDNLYRFGLPTVSIIVAVYLLSAGISLAWVQLRASVTAQDGGESVLAANCPPVGLMFALASIAFVAFIGGRWLAGYGRQRAWQLLRGGASYLMSCFVIALLVMAGVAVLAVAGVPNVFEAMGYVIPGVMIGIGLEIFLTALLESYRPRVPGEIPRPAFDSRVLGLLTAPESLGSVVADLISYQFGVEVSGSWLYRLLGSAITPLTIFGAAVLVALSCLTIVGPDERGVLLRFGAMQAELPPGLHLKQPWPIETVELHPVGEVQQLVVTSDLTGQSEKSPALLWTTDSDRDSQIGQEDFVAAPSGDGAGVSLVSADVTVQYAVADLETFLLGSSDPRAALKAVAQREATEFFASHDIDMLLATGRTAGGPELRHTIQRRVDQAGLGIKVVGVAITSIHPPIGNVSRAFHSQIGAMQQRETLIQRAHKVAVEQLAKVAGSVEISQRIDAEIRALDALRTSGAATPATVAEAERRIDTLLAEARGEAAEILHEARSYRWKRSVGELADGERFAGELLAFQVSPDYYRARRFLEVLAEGLSNRRKFVIAGDPGDTPVFRMDFSDPASAIDMLLNE